MVWHGRKGKSIGYGTVEHGILRIQHECSTGHDSDRDGEGDGDGDEDREI